MRPRSSRKFFHENKHKEMSGKLLKIDHLFRDSWFHRHMNFLEKTTDKKKPSDSIECKYLMFKTANVIFNCIILKYDQALVA